jgi:phosphatidylglycerol---prolipoprotein diacylglyceryl transferase
MYPSLYYAIKDLFGIDLPFFKMIQSFGFFVAIAFLISSYLLALEIKRKENEGLLKPSKLKTLKGAPATITDYITSAIIGFFIGYKFLFIVQHYSQFLEDTQSFILSLQGNFLGGILGAGLFIYLKYKESENAKLDKPQWVEETVHPHELVGNITMIAAIAGIIGAKIFHNLENWDEFMADPIGGLLSFSGLTMYGGLIVASISIIYYARKNNITVTHLIDAAAPALMIGYAIGRIGCQVSGDGDWGIDNLLPKPEWLSWAPDWMWSYDYPHNVNGVGVPIPGCFNDRYCYHLVPSVFPTPFYETIMCTLLFLLLWAVRKRITTPGVLFSLYLMLNGLERFFIEKIRVNTLYHVNGFAFTQAELISSILFFLGVAGIFYFKKLEQKSTIQ